MHIKLVSKVCHLEQSIVKIYPFFLLFLGYGRKNVGELQIQLPLFNMVQPQSKILKYRTGLYVCKICGKFFRCQNCCCVLMAFHQGTSKGTIYNCVLNQMVNRRGICIFMELV
jgi:hypothetical protein